MEIVPWTLRLCRDAAACSPPLPCCLSRRRPNPHGHAEVWLVTLRRPEVRAKLEDQDYEILGLDATQFAARIRRDTLAYTAIIKGAGITAD
jgi:hypothetical protein